MSEKRWIAYAVTVKNGRRHYTRVGEAAEHRDCVQVDLDAIPVNGIVELRVSVPRGEG